MERKELNKTLRDRARQLGLCDKWYKEWYKESTRQELIDKYIEGIDFCIANDYPKLDFIEENFPKKQLQHNGIYLNDEVEARNSRTLVFLGKSHGTIKYDGRHTGNIYVRHGSEVEISATENARVFVEIYENCKLKASADRDSKIFVYQHGGAVQADGCVYIRDKRKA